MLNERNESEKSPSYVNFIIKSMHVNAEVKMREKLFFDTQMSNADEIINKLFDDCVIKRNVMLYLS